MDALFKALGDPTRRALLDALRANDGQTLSALEARLEMSRFGVMKHLGVLETAGLIVTVKRGRFKHHYFNPLPLQEAIDRWVEPLIVQPAIRQALDLKSQLEGTAPMTSTPDFVLRTVIRCTPDALWLALTDADTIAQHHFLSNEVAQEDCTFVWRKNGAALVKMRVLKAEPPHLLETTFEPMGEGDGKPSRVVTRVEVEGDACVMTIEHYDLTFPVTPGEGVHDGWSRFAASLKSFLETGTPLRQDTAA